MTDLDIMLSIFMFMVVLTVSIGTYINRSQELSLVPTHQLQHQPQGYQLRLVLA
jgi:hypothetical protein